MAEKKKQKPAAFAQEKKTFTGEIPKKANEGKGKKSAAYQPRDADTTSGHDVQRSKNTKKYQKADASGQNVQKSEGAEAGEKSKSDFMQPDSTFTEEAGEEQGRKIASDDYRHRDTYHSSQKKGRYQRREIKSRERVKQFDFEQDFQTKDTTFTEEAEPEFHGSKKLDRLQKKAEKARKKTEAARKKIPKKTEYSLERVFDEKTGRTKYVLTSVKKEKPFKPDSPVKRAAGRVGMESSNFAHSKVAEVEKENSGVEAAHKTEQSGEDVYRFFKGHYKGKTERRRAKAAKLEKSRCRKRSISVIRSSWKKIRKCRKRPFRSSCRKDCKSSVSNGNMQKQDGRDRQRKPQRKQRRSPGIFLQRQPERYRRLHQKMFRFCLP